MDIIYPAGATPLDPDETEDLLLSHITTREELNQWEQLNIGDAEEWAFSRNHKDLLANRSSAGCIKKCSAKSGPGPDNSAKA